MKFHYLTISLSSTSKIRVFQANLCGFFVDTVIVSQLIFSIFTSSQFGNFQVNHSTNFLPKKGLCLLRTSTVILSLVIFLIVIVFH